MAGDVPGTAPEDPARPGVPPAPGRPAPTRLALYRRYRPATFAEVKGQEHVTEPLRQALRNDRIHHAYLFSGPRGCGKTSSARILARSLNCVQGPTPDPCGVCESCVALAPSGPGSIDVIEIDAASHGGVDDARDLRERAFYAPVSGRFKVYIIDEAHMVTREGFNALLKLVEEPPPHLKFVFATTEPEKVIATIRSRTHHYPFRLVPPAVLRSHLEEILAAEGVSYQPQMLPLVVRAGAGSVRDSLSVLDQLLAGAGEEGLTYERTVALLGYTDDSLLDEMIDALAAGDGAAAFGTVDRVVQGGHDPRRFAGDLLDRLRDLIILAAVPGAGQTGLLDAPADRLEKMADQAGRFGQAELARSAEILSDGLIQMRGTTSPRLLLELMCAQVLLPGASTSEKALMARLEQLERRLEGVPAEGLAPRAGRPAAPPPRPAPAQPRSAPAQDRPAPDQPRPAPDQPRPAPDQDHQAGDGPRSAAGEGPASEDRPAPDGEHPASPEDRPAPRRRPATGDGPPAVDQVSAAEPAAGVMPAKTPAPARTGAVDADLLRERWPDVLNAVKGQRRIAWMLLGPATVESLESGVLTVAFPKEGEAKGFASSGCDQVLANALTTLLGLNVRVRAVVGGSAGGGPRGSTRPAAAPGSGHGPGNPAAPDTDTSADTAGEPGAAAETTPAAEAAAPGAQAPEAAPGVPQPRGAQASGRAASGAPTGQDASGAARRAAAGGRRGQAAKDSSATPAAPDAGFDEEEWPDDAGPAGAGPGPTGMELIEQQLGGRVIEEIEEP
jgi:DNA polymerase III subunit gamma/tau